MEVHCIAVYFIAVYFVKCTVVDTALVCWSGVLGYTAAADQPKAFISSSPALSLRWIIDKVTDEQLDLSSDFCLPVCLPAYLPVYRLYILINPVLTCLLPQPLSASVSSAEP